jgi:hypothetical protein
VLSLGPCVKSGGEGKAETDGNVDIDDLTCETTRVRILSGLGYEFGQFEKPRTGDWHDDEGSVVLFMESAGGAPSNSAGPREVPRGNCCSETSRGKRVGHPQIENRNHPRNRAYELGSSMVKGHRDANSSFSAASMSPGSLGVVPSRPPLKPPV